jgi:hypothetical protein
MRALDDLTPEEAWSSRASNFILIFKRSFTEVISSSGVKRGDA